MYTTLQTLKDVKACTTGFGRLLAFFGTSKDVKDQRIPLHAIALISGIEDCEWALNQSLTIAHSEFEDVFNRTAFDVWQYLLYKGGIHRSPVQSKARHPVNAFNERALRCRNWTEVDAFIKECRFYSYSTELFNSVVSQRMWTCPVSYLNFILEKVKSSQNRGLTYSAFDFSDPEAEFNSELRTSRTLFSEYYDDGHRPGERMARVLKPEGTYDFLFELKVNEKRIKLERTSNKTARLDLSDPQSAFEAVRSVLSRSSDSPNGEESSEDESEDSPISRHASLVSQTEDWDPLPTATVKRVSAPRRSPTRALVSDSSHPSDEDNEADD